jgi:hypothetical protein
MGISDSWGIIAWLLHLYSDRQEVMHKVLYSLILCVSLLVSEVNAKKLDLSPAEVFIALLSQHLIYPQMNAVEAYAKAFEFKDVPKNMQMMLNSTKSYAKQTIHHGILIIGYNTNSPIAITVQEGFNAQQTLSELSGFVSLKHKGEFSELGQKAVVKEMFSNGNSIGFVFISYGEAKQIKGTGSIAFLKQLPR